MTKRKTWPILGETDTHSHGKSWKILGKKTVMEKSWKMKETN